MQPFSRLHVPCIGSTCRGHDEFVGSGKLQAGDYSGYREVQEFLSRVDIPGANGVAFLVPCVQTAAGRQCLAICRKRELSYGVSVPGKLFEQTPVMQIPETNNVVATAGCQQPFIR